MLEQRGLESADTGIGREFGPEGMAEFVELQAVVSKDPMPPLPVD